jgi:hypothetical protein
MFLFSRALSRSPRHLFAREIDDDDGLKRSRPIHCQPPPPSNGEKMEKKSTLISLSAVSV